MNNKKQIKLENFFSLATDEQDTKTPETIFDHLPEFFISKKSKKEVGRPRKPIIIELKEDEIKTYKNIENDNIENKSKWSDVENEIVKSFIHIWGSDGSHIGWNTTENVINQYKQLFPNANEKTIKNKISAEHSEYNNNGNYLKCKPDLKQKIKQLYENKDEEVINEKSISGAPVVIDQTLYPEIIKKVLLFKGSPGFGTRTVRAIASCVYQEQFKSIYN